MKCLLEDMIYQFVMILNERLNGSLNEFDIQQILKRHIVDLLKYMNDDGLLSQYQQSTLRGLFDSISKYYIDSDIEERIKNWTSIVNTFFTQNHSWIRVYRIFDGKYLITHDYTGIRIYDEKGDLIEDSIKFTKDILNRLIQRANETRDVLELLLEDM